VLAHRGASHDAPENTLLAFQRARVAGADGVELDVQQCATGEVVVFHDDDLRRLAGWGARLQALPFDALREVDLGQGQTIPTLAEALAEIPELLVNVELKVERGLGARLADAALAVIAAAGAADRVLVSSFHPLALFQVRRRAPDLPTGLLFHSEQAAPLRRALLAPLLRPTALHPEAALVDAIALARWRRRGYAVNVWTVDDPREIAALAALGIDAIITNQPARAVAALRG
jgi:glycerophosphoryl diester phosphodiesterase